MPRKRWHTSSRARKKWWRGFSRSLPATYCVWTLITLTESIQDFLNAIAEIFVKLSEGTQ
jgi:hypothetical protein